jgi:hypothetical protein
LLVQSYIESDRFQNTRPGIRPKAKLNPIANDKTKASFELRSAISLVSDFRPNQIIAHRRIKNTGKRTKNKIAKETANPGKVCSKPTKNTYLAQNKEVPGKPIVTKAARTDIIHSMGADVASPPM